jgi:hypothetical protein
MCVKAQLYLMDRRSFPPTPAIVPTDDQKGADLPTVRPGVSYWYRDGDAV